MFLKNLSGNLHPGATSQHLVEHFLISSYFYFCLTVFLLLVSSILLNLRRYRETLREIDRRTWKALSAIFILALLLRIFFIDHMPQVYFDEQFFLSCAESLSRFQMHIASSPLLDKPFYHISPAGWQSLLSLLYLISGVNTEYAFYLSSVLGGLSVILIFLVTFLLFHDEAAALFSSLLLAVLPIHLRISGSAAHEPCNFFFLLLAFCLVLFYLRNPSFRTLIPVFFTSSYFLHIRAENGLLVLFLLLPLFVFDPGFRRNIKTAHLLYLAFFFIIFSVPYFLTVLYGIDRKAFYFYEPEESIRLHVASNLKYNLLYWIENRIHPVFFTVLALIGLTVSLRKSWKWGSYLVLWFLALDILYSLYPSCDFSLRHTLDSWRTALCPSVPVLILGGLGGSYLSKVSRMRVRSDFGTCALILLILFTPYLFRDFVRGKHLWMHLYDFLKSARDSVPPKAILLADPPLGTPSHGFALLLGQTIGVYPGLRLITSMPLGPSLETALREGENVLLFFTGDKRFREMRELCGSYHFEELKRDDSIGRGPRFFLYSARRRL